MKGIPEQETEVSDKQMRTPEGDKPRHDLILQRATFTDKVSSLTLVGAVCMGLITVVPTVVVAVAGPILRDAATAVAFELHAGAGMAAAGFIAVVSTVVVCTQ